MPVSIGDKLGPFEILAHIGKGGMGEVWKAHDPRLNRDVAIKVSAAQFSDRFQREAHAIAALNHPNVCTLHDVGSDYLVMEFVDGKPLKGPLPLDKILSYTAQICDAIDAAHRKGIVHRDLKPSNILVTRQGIKVLDFGIAKTAGLETLTETGALIGTPAYMSPEQREGKEADTRSDIYSLGCVIHEMATGNRIPNKTLDPPALDRRRQGLHRDGPRRALANRSRGETRPGDGSTTGAYTCCEVHEPMESRRSRTSLDDVAFGRVVGLANPIRRIPPGPPPVKPSQRNPVHGIRPSRLA